MKNAKEAQIGNVTAVRKEDPWVLTDDDTLQCRHTLDEDRLVYELVQVNDYTSVGQGYRISQETVSLMEYSPEEILEYLKLYGYQSLEDFIDQHSGEIEWGIIAEMVFETNCLRCEGERVETFTAAGKKVEQITGLRLNEYYSETATGGKK